MVMKEKIVNVFMVLLLLCVIVISSVFGTTMAYAQSTAESDTNAGGDVAQPRALLVDVVLGLNGGNGEVWSIAQVRTAILTSTIQVVLELYSSDTYQDSYTKMTLEKRVNTSNLKKGESIKAVVSTNGVQKYWRGRMYYKADGGKWNFNETQTLLLDENGALVA